MSMCACWESNEEKQVTYTEQQWIGSQVALLLPEFTRVKQLKRKKPKINF